MSARTDTRPAVKQPATPTPRSRSGTVPGKAVVLVAKGGAGAGKAWWRYRTGLAPASTGAGIVAAGSALSIAPVGWEAGAWLLSATCAAGSVWWHHVVRRRQNKNPKTPVWSATATAGLAVLGDVMADGIAHPIPAIAAASVTAVAQIAWWNRSKTPAAPKNAAPPKPAASREQTWAARITPVALPDSALTDVQPILAPDGEPNGFSGHIVLNMSGPIRHTANSITGDTIVKIALAYGAEPGNVAVEPSRTDRIPLRVFERNPLEPKTEWTGPIAPGSFRHLFGTSITGDPVFHEFLLPDFGSTNGLLVGATGSGKSEAMLSLLNMERHTVDSEGRNLIASVLLDPQHGASYPGWPDKVALFASEPRDIIDALDWLVEEMDRRVRLMAEREWKLWVPTPDEPMVSSTFDELLLFLKQIDRKLQQRVLKPLTGLANGGRKTLMSVRIGTQYPSLDDTGDDGALRSAVSKYVLLLKTNDRQTGAMAAAGRPVGDAALLPERFADNSPATGVGYYLGGTARSGVMMRGVVAAKSWRDSGTTCRLGADRSAWMAARVEAERQQAAGEMEAAGSPGFPLQRDAEVSELDAWPAAQRMLLQVDRPMKTGEIAEMLNRPDNAVSQALGRARKRGEVAGDGHRGWVLAQYASALEGAR